MLEGLASHKARAATLLGTCRGTLLGTLHSKVDHGFLVLEPVENAIFPEHLG